MARNGEIMPHPVGRLRARFDKTLDGACLKGATIAAMTDCRTMSNPLEC